MAVATSKVSALLIPSMLPHTPSKEQVCSHEILWSRAVEWTCYETLVEGSQAVEGKQVSASQVAVVALCLLGCLLWQ